MKAIKRAETDARMRFLLNLKNARSKNPHFVFASVVTKEQCNALAQFFDAVDFMISADAKFLASDVQESEPRQ